MRLWIRLKLSLSHVFCNNINSTFQPEMIYDSFLPSSLPVSRELLLLAVLSAAGGQGGKKISENPGRDQRSRTLLCQLSSCAWSRLAGMELWPKGGKDPAGGDVVCESAALSFWCSSTAVSIATAWSRVLAASRWTSSKGLDLHKPSSPQTK